MPKYTKYTSKDFVIQGSMLRLDPEEAWEQIDKRVRTAIRKARAYNPRIIKMQGTADEIRRFYPFCPNNHDLPEKLLPGQHMYFAYLENSPRPFTGAQNSQDGVAKFSDAFEHVGMVSEKERGELVGGIVVTELGDRLYLHFHAATEKGKKHNVPSLLLWHIVEEFQSSRFKYLDVGASYRPGLQNYFQSFATSIYPIIMHPPEYTPKIMINPLENDHAEGYHYQENNSESGVRLLSEHFGGREYTFFPRGMYAIHALFRWMQVEGKLDASDEVAIFTTTETPYISSCVTSAIEETCKWSRELTDKTKAIFVIHEFGFPHPRLAEFRKIADARGIPLVEDCAYSWGTEGTGKTGDYIIYSLTKIFPVPYGGLLVGKHFDHEYIWKNFQSSDKAKESMTFSILARYLPELPKIRKKRQENYKKYTAIFGADRAFFGPVLDTVSPGAFVLKMSSENDMRETAKFVSEFGVECGNYWKNSAVFLPVHQNITPSKLEYIAASVFGSEGYERVVEKLKEKEI